MHRLSLAAVAASATASCTPTPGSGWMNAAQEQRACANAGIAPGSGGFATCVTNLDATMRQDPSLDH